MSVTIATPKKSRRLPLSLPGSDMAIIDEQPVDANGTATIELPAADPAPIRNIPIKEIWRGANHRPVDTKSADFKELVESIRTAGLKQPGGVYEMRPDQVGSMGFLYELGFGNRRLAACEAAGLTHFEARVFPPAEPAVIEQSRSIENLHRKDLSPAEELVGVRALLRSVGGDIGLAASTIGKSDSWVRDRMYLSHCTDHVIKLLDTKRLLLGHARLLAKVGDPKEQDKLANMAARHADVTDSMWPVQKLAQAIDDAQRSLKVVPWRLELPFAGKPACSTCEHNTASDPVLFETGKDDPGLGNCTNESCFSFKMKKADEGKTRTVQKLEKQKQEPTAENVRSVAPEFLRETSIVGYAKRQMTPAKPAGKQSASKKAAEDKPKTAIEIWNDAAGEFIRAHDSWDTDLCNAIDAAINKLEGPKWAAVLLLFYSKAWCDAAKQTASVAQIYYSQPARKAQITQGKPCPAPLASLIQCVARATPEDLNKLHAAKHERLDDVDSYDMLRATSDMLLRLAAALDIKEIKPEPVWDDFNPEKKPDPKAKPAAAPAAASKPKKTKTKKPAKAPAGPVDLDGPEDDWGDDE